MIKKTKKNVARLKWFSFAMSALSSTNMLLMAKLAADGYFENKLLLGSILLTIFIVSWILWFLAYCSLEKIQEEMENKNGKEN